MKTLFFWAALAIFGVFLVRTFVYGITLNF
jgi:hypothetical protein